jgi:hypothetical protein
MGSERRFLEVIPEPTRERVDEPRTGTVASRHSNFGSARGPLGVLMQGESVVPNVAYLKQGAAPPRNLRGQTVVDLGEESAKLSGGLTANEIREDAPFGWDPRPDTIRWASFGC